MAASTTVVRRSLGLLAGVARAARVPVEFLHECTHVLWAVPWADQWEIVVGPAESDLSMHTVVDFDDDAPEWAIAASHLAPFVTGLLGALVAGVLMLQGDVEGPVTSWDLLVWSALAMAWVMYTRPSAGDLAGAKAALQDQDQGQGQDQATQEADDDGAW